MKKELKYSAIIMVLIMMLTFMSSFTFAQTETPLITIACISDLHNQEILLTNGSIRGSITETCNALAATEDVDVLLLGGDVSSDTQVSQDKLNSVLGNVVNATTKVTDNVLWVTGNHDYSCGEGDGYNSAPYYDFYMKDNVGQLASEDSYYETFNNEANLLAYHYVLDGFDFICINTSHETLYGNLQNTNYAYTDGAMRWVDSKLAEIGNDKTVFVMGHLPFRDSNSLSSSGKGMVEPCNTTFKNILSKYPNALYLYGHDHATDSAYIRTDTAQRVTQYLSDGGKASQGVDCEITQSSLWSFESVSGGYCIKSVETGKYLGIDGNLNTVSTPLVWTASANSGAFTFSYSEKSIHIGTGNKFSFGDPSPMTLYKKDGDVYKKSTTIEEGAQYLLVSGDNYAMTNLTNGSSGTSIRLEPLTVTVSGDYAGNPPESDAKNSFISAFMGSMRYYSNSIDAWVGPSNSKVVQSLLIYVYADRIVLQMKNYGISDGGSYELKPFVISRTVVDTSSLDFTELESAQNDANAIISSTVYENYSLDSKSALENALLVTDVKFVYQKDIDIAAQTLKDAISSMQLLQMPVDKTTLRLAIATAELIMSSDDYLTRYPMEKRTELESALADARTMLDSENAEQISLHALALLALSHNMTGHSFTDYVPDNNATCTQNSTEKAVCTVDGCNETDTREIPDTALGHDWGEYVYNNDATTQADGTKTAVCKNDPKHTITVTAEGTKIILVEPTKKFNDVETGKWYTPYIDYAVTFKLLKGMTDTTFEPNTNLTRAMFVQILANMSGVDTTNRAVTTKFSDVPSGKWYTPAVKWANENEIVNGLTETTFGPESNIERQQMCVMLVRYAKVCSITLKETFAKTTFSDDASIGTYARESVYKCQMAGIVNGMDAKLNNFVPSGNATRGQIAKIVSIFHQDYMLGK